MDTAILILAGIFLLLGVGAIVLYLGPKMKGSIKISLPKTAYEGSETISGSFELNCKKEIISNGLYAIAYAERLQKDYISGRGSSSSWVKIYENKQPVDGKKTYPAGFSRNFEFNVSLPKSLGPQSEGVIASISKAKNMIFGNKIRWRLKIHLDAKGLDLSKTQNITVNFTE
jgi:hypothetical protein